MNQKLPSVLSSVAVDLVLSYLALPRRLSALRVLAPTMPLGGLSRGAVGGTGGGTGGGTAGEDDHQRLRLDGAGEGAVTTAGIGASGGTAGVPMTGVAGMAGAAALGGSGKCAGFTSFTRPPVL